MRTALTVYPVRRISVPTARRKGSGQNFSRMLGKLNAASDRLSRARGRR